jgi:hypothetical protein
MRANVVPDFSSAMPKFFEIQTLKLFANVRENAGQGFQSWETGNTAAARSSAGPITSLKIASIPYRYLARRHSQL